MGTIDKTAFEPHLHWIGQLPFVRNVDVKPAPEHGRAPDWLLVLKTPTGQHRYLVEHKRTHLTEEIVEHVATRMRAAHGGAAWLLFAPYVGAPMAQRLAAHRIQYVDRFGNCRIDIDGRYVAVIEGRRPPRELQPLQKGTGARAAGYRVLFTLLTRPDLAQAPVRAIADAAGAGKTAVADVLIRLQREGLIARGGRQRHLFERQELVDRWLAGYATVLRPHLLIGRYRTADTDPEALEHRIEEEFGDAFRWVWGGTAAAARLVGHYRGRETVVHVGDAALEIDLARRLRALPAGDGPLTLLRAPTATAFEGAQPRTAHPLLVYAELLVGADDRAREAAREVYQRFLAKT